MRHANDEIFVKARFRVPSSHRDMLAALLDLHGWDGMEYTPDEVIAYIAREKFDEKFTEEWFGNFMPRGRWSWEVVPPRNWNAEWEKNFRPVFLDGIAYIRARFHPPAPRGVEEIIITPRMSFGTGHHQTTRLMLELLQNENLSDKSLIDMGTGTGILAIYAAKKGARPVFAVDNDPRACRNARENLRENNTDNVTVIEGDRRVLKELPAADYFLANINRNIILQDFPAYAEKIAPGGKMILSGFYETDVPLIREAAEALGLTEEKLRVQDGWAGMKFVRSNEKS